MQAACLTGGRQGEGVLQSWCGASTAPSFPQLPAICHRCQHHVLSQQGLPGLPEGKGAQALVKEPSQAAGCPLGTELVRMGRRDRGGWRSVRDTG